MLAEIGQFALIVGLVLAFAQTTLTGYGVKTGNEILKGMGNRAALGQFVFVLFAFFVLTALYVLSDFSVLNVAQNSHTTKPLIYKITGVWGNHEGSMLLWVLILATFGFFLARSKKLPAALRDRAVAIQGLIGFSFLAFLIFTSNPFIRIFPSPIDGQGLNPILQDIGLAIHPPFLYLGYVGLSTAFSLAAAGLLMGKINREWATAVRPWVLSAWAFLTVGIGLGSWWAYHELGWGGWWFWDPVENASFMPWLFATALFHSLRVVEKREALKSWTALLAILAFSFSLIGTFLVRSGILTSVHAFAVDPTRGGFLLILLAIAIGGALLLYGLRAPLLKPKDTFGPVSREGGLLFNNVFFVSACLTVFLGTFYPLFMDAMGGNKISVGAPYFNSTFVPIMIPALLLMPLVVRMSWKKANFITVIKDMRYAGGSALVLGAIVGFFYWPDSFLALLGIVLGGWIAFGTLSDFISKVRSKSAKTNTLEKFKRMPKAALGMTIAHLGAAILVISITSVSFWQEENIGLMEIGDTLEAGDLQVTLEAIDLGAEENFQYLRGQFTIYENGEVVTPISAERRIYNVRRMETTEAGIYSTLSGDYYLTLGGQGDAEQLAVHFFKNPLVPWLWGGGLMLVLGALITLVGGRKKAGVGA
ncbi:MAG: heme lyase CcmF/NrfE family subunit [Sphingomonadales bacterium]